MFMIFPAFLFFIILNDESIYLYRLNVSLCFSFVVFVLVVVDAYSHLTLR